LLVAVAGQSPPKTNITESYNGTSWTEVGDMNTVRYGVGGAGTQTAALAFAGEKPDTPSVDVESWKWYKLDRNNKCEYK